NKHMYEGAFAFPRWQLLEMKEDGARITRRVQVEPAVGELPVAVKKVLGDRLAYTEEGTFDKTSKRYAFKVSPSTLAEKTRVSGELWCEKIGEKKIRRICRISVEVRVPLVGGMVEDRILSDLRSSYDDSTAFTNTYIRDNSL